jgi:hypothetical protein
MDEHWVAVVVGRAVDVCDETCAVPHWNDYIAVDDDAGHTA